MIIIAAVDEKYGMMFNKRRQSQDWILREKILNISRKSCLWMNEYSLKQFGADNAGEIIKVDNDFLKKAGLGEFCFVEDQCLLSYANKIEQIILFKWNRTYPADFHFDINLCEKNWRIIETEEFVGYSHKNITKEVYIHEKQNSEKKDVETQKD